MTPRLWPNRARATSQFAAVAMLLAVLTLLAGACQKRAVDQLVDDSLVHLQAAEKLMQNAQGDEFKLREAVMIYRTEHSKEFARLRAQGESQMAALSEEERRAVAVQAKTRADALLAKLQLQAQRFPDSRRALILVRPLVVAGTPKMAAGTRPNWIPPEPPAPPMMDMPGEPTAAAARAIPKAPGAFVPVADGPVTPTQAHDHNHAEH